MFDFARVLVRQSQKSKRSGKSIKNRSIKAKDRLVKILEKSSLFYLTPAARMRSNAREFVNLAKILEPVAFG